MKNLSANMKQLILGSIISILLLSILIVAAVADYKIDDALIALSVAQLGIAILWYLIRSGLLTTSSYGSRNYAKNQLHKRNEKIGVYSEEKDSKIKIQKYNSARDIEEKSKAKSKYGIYLMLFIGIIELSIALIVAFA